MTEMTKAAFARRHGVSKQAAQKWAGSGYLAMTPAGLVDVEKSDARLRDARLGGFTEAVNQVDAGGQPLDPEQDLEANLDEFLDRLLKGQFGTFAEAERIKENALAGLRTLELRRKAGALIELEPAKTAFFGAARAFRDALLQWPNEAGPLIAADLNLPAAAVTEVLVAHVRKLLAGLGEPDAGALQQA